MAVTHTQLLGHVGKSIDDFCPSHFSTAGQSHCAHFVSHALGIQLGTLCSRMKSATRNNIGATIRVNELYNLLSCKGPWANRPAAIDGLLVFVISASHMRGGVMQPVRQKHVGILSGGQVFNFSNTLHRVVADPSVAAFHAKFQKAYKGNDISLYYGVAA